MMFLAMPALSLSAAIVHGWTFTSRPTMPKRAGPLLLFFAEDVQTAPTERDGAPTEEQDSSFDGYEFTTKTNKQLVFDASASRFFETSLEPTVPFQATSFVDDTDSGASDDLVSFSYDTTKYSPTDLVPTSVLFGIREEQYEDVNTEKKDIQDISFPIRQNNNDNNNPDAVENLSSNPVMECYDAWNRRDMMAAVDLFDDNFFYTDSLYAGPITNRAVLKRHFETQANLLPPECQLVVDHWAVDTESGAISTEWHVERPDGASIPFTRGISLYKLNPKNGKIQSGFRVSEMLVKPSKSFTSALVGSTKRIMALSGRSSRVSAANPTPASAPPKSTDASIAERYYEAWNRRDIEAALNCFVDDCSYQTEDPVFVESLLGKDALRRHLVQNADTLPEQSRIVLDQVITDRHGRGTIGTEWHLEVNGLRIPGLRGCGMYTVDQESGLLRTGFDVTEAPVKMPLQALPSLSLPAKLFFR